MATTKQIATSKTISGNAFLMAMFVVLAQFDISIKPEAQTAIITVVFFIYNTAIRFLTKKPLDEK